MINPINLTLPALALTAALSFIPSGGKSVPDGYWENSDTYVYYTLEEAVYEGEEDGIAYFETADGNVWSAYIYDSDLQDGETVTLTFENRESHEEYVLAEEYGTESVTRIDNARVIEID